VIKPTDLTYVSVAAQATQKQQNQTSSTTAQTPILTAPLNTTAPAFDYEAELKRISIDIETKLKPKLDAAIANLQLSIDALEKNLNRNSISRSNPLRLLKLIRQRRTATPEILRN